MSFCYSVNAGPVILAFCLGWFLLFTVFIMQLSILSKLNRIYRSLINQGLIEEDKAPDAPLPEPVGIEHTPWMKGGAKCSEQ